MNRTEHLQISLISFSPQALFDLLGIPMISHLPKQVSPAFHNFYMSLCLFSLFPTSLINLSIGLSQRLQSHLNKLGLALCPMHSSSTLSLSTSDEEGIELKHLFLFPELLPDLLSVCYFNKCLHLASPTAHWVKVFSSTVLNSSDKLTGLIPGLCLIYWDHETLQ